MRALIRSNPNGATHLGNTQVPLTESIGETGGTGGTETSKYPEEETSNEIPLVVASERGTAQTEQASARSGL